MRIFTTALILLMAITAQGQCEPGNTELTMKVVTDRYGTETTWQVTGIGGNPVHASGGPYTNGPASGEYPQTPVTFCVPDESVIVITFNDSYGDGMCCAYGNGGWNLEIDGMTVSSGGSFGYTEVVQLALGTDLGLVSLTVPDVILQGTTQISGTVRNNGLVPISSFTVNYTVSGGAVVSQDITTTIQPGATYDITFSTPWDAPVGNHELVVELSNVDGDISAANNTISKTISVATQSIERRTVIEEFTSSTCVPCAQVNATFDPFLSGLGTNQPGSNVLAVKYQMNWPNAGNDPSYNADGNTRKNFYGVTGIPNFFFDGTEPGGGTYAAVVNNATSKPAYMDISMTHTVDGSTVDVEVTVTPYANFTGQHRLFIVATENHYSYPGSVTTQDDFYYVMRKVLPNGSGVNVGPMIAGESQTFTQSHTFTHTGGIPLQNSFSTWSASLNNITLVAFVQNTSSKAVLQATNSSITTNINELDAVAAATIHPNPTTGIVNIGFQLPDAADMNLRVMNMLGEVVIQRRQGFGSGQQLATLDLGDLANGTYHIRLMTDGMTTTRKVVVNR